MESVAERLASFVCEYEISLSQDGENFVKATDGLVRTYSGELVIHFPTSAARYVRFDVKSNVGDFFGYEELIGRGVSIGELTVFEKKCNA